MNRIYNYYLLSLWILVTACADSDTNGSLPGVTFEMSKDENNFVTFIADGTDDENADYEWKLSWSDGILKGKKIICYLERKGNYEVTLTKTVESKKGISTRNVEIGEDSYYYRNEEQLWWHDEFNRSRIDNTAWNYDIGIGKWGNNEWQNYTNSTQNSFVKDGKLIVRALKTGVGQNIGDYTSARLTTKGKKEINRGRIEVRAKLPGGNGMWAAIWLFGTKAQPYYSELDIMEYVGCDKNIIYGAVHTSATLSSTEKVSGFRQVPDVETDYHIYGINWTDNRIEYYLDTPENIYLSFAPAELDDVRVWPFNNELYLILNLAVGGDWGGMKGVDDSIFPREMSVDYVRFFKKAN